MLEPVAFAIESLRGNRLRTGLSLVGIVIGVASVVAVTSIAGSGAADISKQFESFGQDSVQIYLSGPFSPGGPQPRLDEALARDILRSIPEARAVLSRASFGGRLSRGRLAEEPVVTAVESPYFAAMEASFSAGRAFAPEDEFRRRPVTVLGEELARGLFPEGDPVGKRIDAMIQGVPMSLEVVGVLARKDVLFMDDWNRGAFIPWSTARGRVDGSLTPQDLTVLARSKDSVVALGDSLEAFLADRAGPGVYGVLSPRKWAQENDKMTATISLVLGGVAAISLLVGGIGVMNIMLVAVTERRREIGLRKALGATGRDIRAQFLVEASVLTVAGGAIGLGIGFGVSWFAVKAIGWTFVASAGTAGLAFGISLGTGVFSGLYPAMRAARLDPVDALAAE